MALVGRCLWVCTAVPSWSAAARAEPEQASSSSDRLTLQAPPECAEAGALILSRASELVPEGRRLGTARVEIQRAGEAWEARVWTAAGERRLVGESCAAVMDAAAVVLALAAEPTAPAPPEPQSPAERPAAPAALVPAPRKPLPQPPRARAEPLGSAPARGDAARWQEVPAVVLTAGAFVELGALPGPSAGPRLLLTFNRHAWSIDAGLAALFPRRAELDGSPAIYGDIYWWAGQLSACRRSRGPLAICLGAESGLLVGTGHGVDETATARGTWLAGTFSLAWFGDFGQHSLLSWRADAGMALPAVRPPFGFDEIGVLHRASPVSARAFLGIGWP